MSKTRRRRKKRRHPIFRKASAFLRALDPYADTVMKVILPMIVIGAGWWEDGWEGAVKGTRFVVFWGLGAWIAFNVYETITDAAEGYFNRRNTIHAVIKMLAIVIGLLAFENHAKANAGLALFGFGFIAFIMIVTHVGLHFSNRR